MSVSIEQIKQLREATGVSMMACKKALEEVDGNFDKAVDLLRKKGEAASADRARRATGQGAVFVKIESGKGAMLTLLCETDFVARGDDFLVLGESLVDKLLKGESDEEPSELKDTVLKLGENIQVGEKSVIEGDVLGNYIHSNKRIGVIVALEGGNEEMARDIAMHAAATNPQVLSPEEVSEDLVNKEKEIWTEQLKSEGKPEEILEKIMMGKEKKFREENALLKQAFVKDPDKTIEQFLGDAKVKTFLRYEI